MAKTGTPKGVKAKRNDDEAARALVEWELNGWKTSYASRLALSYNIAESTLWNWKRALKANPQLRVAFDEHKQELNKADWKNQLSETLTAQFKRLKDAAENVQINNLQDYKGLLEATKATLELEISRQYTEYDTTPFDSPAEEAALGAPPPIAESTGKTNTAKN